MSTQVLNQIIQQVEFLNQEEINQLNQYLKAKVFISKKIPSKWQTIRGLMPHSSAIEDAQITLSNLRQQSDNKREQQWKK